MAPANYFFIILLLLFLPTSITAALPDTTASSTRRASIRRGESSSTLSSGALRRNRTPGRTIRDCSRIGTRSDCASTSSCKWCRSDAIDDLCFSKLEAWRLPSQVFTCNSN